MRSVIRVSTPAFAFVLSLLISLSATAQEEVEATPETSAPLTLDRFLPQDTLFTVKVSGLETLLEKAGNLGLMKLWNDPEVRDFFGAALEAAGAQVEPREWTAFPVKEVRPLLENGVTVAGLPGAEDAPGLRFAAALELGADRAAFLSEFERLSGLLAWANGLERIEETFRELKVTRLASRDGGPGLCYAPVENLLILALDRGTLIALLNRKLDAEAALSGDPRHIRCMDRSGGNHADWAFYASRSLLSLAGASSGFPVDALLGRLGLGDLEAVALTLSVQGGGGRDTLYLDCPGEKAGLLADLAPHAVSPEALTLTPSDALFFLAFTLDAPRFHEHLAGLVGDLNPAAGERYRRDLAAFRDASGIDVERDLLSALGDEATFFLSMPSSGGMSLIPDLVFSFRITDEEAWARTRERLTAFLENLSMEVVESRFSGRSLRHVKLPDASIPFSPAFTAESGRLILAGTPMTLKRYLRWRDAEKPSLIDIEAFGEVMFDVPETASALHFANMKRGVELGYGMAIPFLPGFLSREDLPLDPAKLPMTETVAGYVTDASAFLDLNGRGVTLSMRSPIGFGALAALATTAADFFVREDLLAGVMENVRGEMDRNLRSFQGQDLELNEAFQRMRGGELDQAEQRFTFWLDAHSRTHERWLWALRNRGDCRFRMEKYDEAIADYALVARLDRAGRGLACFDMARACAKKGDADGAIRHLEDAVVAGHRIFDVDDAFTALDGDARIADALDLVITVSQLRVENRTEEAADYLSSWLHENPYHDLSGWVLKNRGECLLDMKRVRDAMGDLEKAASRDPRFGAGVYYNLSCLCARANETERAMVFLKKAMDSGFDDMEMIRNDGDLDPLREDPRFKALYWRW